MNTNPDDTTLALWLEDELSGPELAAAEAWAVNQPEQLAAREGLRRWRASMATAMPASEEPPYPDFFNSRVQQGILAEVPNTIPTAAARSSFWKSWFMPLTACAGMALAFLAGRKSQATPDFETLNIPRAIPVEPMLYTPENGVKAEWVSSKKASASVIVLDGVAAIPDSTEFADSTVAVPIEREIDSTASQEKSPTPTAISQ